MEIIDIADPEFDPDKLFAKLCETYNNAFSDSSMYYFLRHIYNVRPNHELNVLTHTRRSVFEIGNALIKLWVEAGYISVIRPMPLRMSLDDALTNPNTTVLCKVTDKGRAVWRQHEKLSESAHQSQGPKET
jgi:hypothetical protein